jgi:hypothetical protein
MPEGERASSPDDVTDLAPRDHERRHHERVHRDDTLNRCYVRAEVLNELGDRNVHDGLIEHHQELRQRQNRQRGPLAHFSLIAGAPAGILARFVSWR